ncbi:MAG: rhomboid family intramembrane serine protease [Thaumarchaeota archaeon]|jgi:membrane associated rhomboid family serine protease|nr:rhomboid family intramembrane serine protease [Candidatus Terraquivivens yellowstonensis]MCL7387352.1 rhomboid family intramembrane serine protease [Candidatus Terraquivivens yellowstonensis]MCL7392475.1 rhomboid family intramembrane serine protease [Candidatus Terraquivivens yellowstonensis]MCL7398431.1 rhomboid family intramembrane serine protease [Candidatus Terraquivivens yellowstonensis]MCL7399151.1 rhomboid family intramembrane serine protease [Candidatus Terraquivivens yellowstonensis
MHHVQERPKAVYVIILINLAVFVYTFMLSDREMARLAYTFGVVPAFIMNGTALHSLVTSMFLHADFFHIFFNMYALFLLGRDCEIAYGSKKFILLYFLSGIFAGILHSVYIYTLFPSDAYRPAIGASGAIFGVMASYAVLFPFRRLFVFFGLIPIAAPAIVVIFGLALIQLLYAVAMPFSSIAYIAHIGGFIAGLIITLIYRAGLRRYYYV